MVPTAARAIAPERLAAALPRRFNLYSARVERVSRWRDLSVSYSGIVTLSIIGWSRALVSRIMRLYTRGCASDVTELENINDESQ